MAQQTSPAIQPTIGAVQSSTISNLAPASNSAPVSVPEVYIKKSEVARRLQKQVRTVDNWMKRGLLPYYKIGRTVCFKWSEVEARLRETCRVDRAGGA